VKGHHRTSVILAAGQVKGRHRILVICQIRIAKDDRQRLQSQIGPGDAGLAWYRTIFTASGKPLVEL
jgi:hypothetical protein